MTTGLASGPGVARGAAADVPDWVRIGLMAAILLVMLVGADPFHDGTAAENAESGAGGNTLNQVLFLAMGAATAGFVLVRGLAAFRPLASLPIGAMLAWLCIASAASTDPAVSLRRLLALFIMMAAAAAFVVLARDLRQFAGVLGGTVLGVVLLCYLGLAVAPERAMHTALDIIEPEHAGSWRGVYAHKNGAGAIMAVFAFVGLFWARTGRPVLGAGLALLAGVFLALTNSKTAMVLAPMVLALTWLCTLSPATAWRRLVLLGPLALLAAATIGSVLVPALGGLAAAVIGDQTFTGRTEIWQFAADNIARRPLTGHGYGAFWETVFYGGGADAATWVNQATDAHNGYLNTALETGYPGLALTVWWFVLAPVSDLQRRAGGRRLDPLALLFLRIWLFGILAASFETILYHATSGLFFLMTASVFGLRCLACAEPVAGGRGA